MSITICDTCNQFSSCSFSTDHMVECDFYEDDDTERADDEPADVCDMCGAHLPDTCRLLNHGNNVFSMVCESCWTKHKEEQV